MEKREIDYKRIEQPSDPLLVKVEQTYVASFPESERRDFSDMIKLLETGSRFNVYALLTGEVYIGFITVWQFEMFVYIEHFAIDESVRNGGFGGTVMKRFLKKFSLPVILEVELPEEEISARRIGFYERLGFQLDAHEYKQPPYDSGGLWIPMRLMSYGNIDMNERFESVRQNLYTFVYGLS